MAVQAQLCYENLGFATCGSQDWLMSSVLGIDDDNGVGCFNFQEQTQLLQQQGFQSQSLGIGSYLDALLEKQRQEVDLVLQLQNERLKAALQEEARVQLGSLLQRYESNVTSLLRQKDEHVACARKKTMELEQKLRRIEIENQTWQIRAKESEARVVDLSNTLNQMRDRVSLSFSAPELADDAESFCDNRGDNGGGERENEKMGCCKWCKVRSSCIVFFPCRHLCACKPCEASLLFCPVCESAKEGSLEVFLA
ncbi:hypothetical protein NMG60_11024468 [Bertholletia excelsa]